MRAFSPLRKRNLFTKTREILLRARFAVQIGGASFSWCVVWSLRELGKRLRWAWVVFVRIVRTMPKASYSARLTNPQRSGSKQERESAFAKNNSILEKRFRLSLAETGVSGFMFSPDDPNRLWPLTQE
ncbi:hypothetical protein BSKO_11374 [Bryopsis sp. KO-2023]|nr:hypothetical protein BSKO_11374 [Bryopsis sp. KO-2023]